MGTVSKAEFAAMMHNVEHNCRLNDCGVNVPALAEFADFVFRDGDELTFNSFMRILIQFRGNNRVATVKDVVDLRIFLSQEVSRLNAALTSKPSNGSSHFGCQSDARGDKA